MGKKIIQGDVDIINSGETNFVVANPGGVIHASFYSDGGCTELKARSLFDIVGLASNESEDGTYDHNYEDWRLSVCKISDKNCIDISSNAMALNICNGYEAGMYIEGGENGHVTFPQGFTIANNAFKVGQDCYNEEFLCADPNKLILTEYGKDKILISLDDQGYLKLQNLVDPQNELDAATKKYVDSKLEIWVPTGAPVSTTITSATGKSWECQYQSFINTLTQKTKVEYTLYSLTEETATKEPISFSVLGMSTTIGAQYKTDTVGYANLPKPISGDTYWTFNSITWDEASDVGNQCTPLPFRGSGGFETRVLVINSNPPEQITFKKFIASVTLYQK